MKLPKTESKLKHRHARTAGFLQASYTVPGPVLNSVAFRLIIWPVLRKATGSRYSLISELWRKQAIKGTRTRHSESQSVQGQTGQFMDLNTAAGCFWLILWDSKDAPRMYYYIMYAELLLCATATAPADARCHLMSPQGFAAVGSWARMSLSPLAVAFGARTLHSAKK